MKILVIGSGGREHALCWKLKQSPLVDSLLCAPGNPGIASLAQCFPIAADDLDAIMTLAQAEQPRLVVIGPEVPLVAGLANRLREAGFAVFGPNKEAAKLEGSKSFSKQLMQEAAVPTARFETHTDPAKAEALIRSCK